MIRLPPRSHRPAPLFPVTPLFRSAWLFRILRNAWIDRIRRVLPEVAEVPESATPSEYWSHDSRLISTIAVRQAMERMPAAYRDIIALVDLCGFAYAEAAAILDVPKIGRAHV